jgi:hypothetical protein
MRMTIAVKAESCGDPSSMENIVNCNDVIFFKG